ncbi:hypothetical protein ACQXX7_11255 [Corynebacterium diphtheriae]
MYISTATMAAIFTLLAFLSGVVIWLVIIAGRLSEQVMTLFACNNVMDDDLAAVESDIQDIYDEMGIKPQQKNSTSSATQTTTKILKYLTFYRKPPKNLHKRPTGRRRGSSPRKGTSSTRACTRGSA